MVLLKPSEVKTPSPCKNKSTMKWSVTVSLHSCDESRKATLRRQRPLGPKGVKGGGGTVVQARMRDALSMLGFFSLLARKKNHIGSGPRAIIPDEKPKSKL